MTAKNTTITFASTNANDVGTLRSADGAQRTLRHLLNHLEGGLNGSHTVRSYTVQDTGVAATGTVTLTSFAAGTVLLINGVPFTAVSGTATSGNNEFDVSGNDAADATALAAAINASTTAGVVNTVVASASSNVVTLTAYPGAVGNAITIENLGVVGQANVILASVANNDTLVINGVTLTAKTTVTDTTNQFLRGVSNAADAAALAVLINSTATDPLITNHVRALVRSATVYLYSKLGGLAGNTTTVTQTGGTMTVSSARLVGGTIAQYEGAQATGTVTISGADGGNYTVTTNGVSTGNVVGSIGDDTATAVSIVAAINGLTDALVRGHVTAANSAGVITITAVRGGTLGNAITLAATGTGATAGGTRLTGGAVPTVAVISGARHTPIRSGQRLSGGSNDTAVSYTL